MIRLVKAGIKLRDQVNKRFPKRDKTSDGWVGDRAHSARISDHNPDAQGWVHAIDIDKDFGKEGDAQRFADELIKCAKYNRDRGRLKYVIFNGKIASGTYKGKYWVWRPYKGANKHKHHIHVSFTKSAELDGSAWPLPILSDRL